MTALLRGYILPGDSQAALLMINGPTCAYQGGNRQKQLYLPCGHKHSQRLPQAPGISAFITVSPERRFSEGSGISSYAMRRDCPEEPTVRCLSLFPCRYEGSAGWNRKEIFAPKLQASNWLFLCATFALATSHVSRSGLSSDMPSHDMIHFHHLQTSNP